jgi:hypothetical protein
MEILIYPSDRKQELGEDTARKLVRSLRAPDILPQVYPSLFRGLAEGSLHSYMLSALIVLGDRLGYSAVCDSPVFDHLDNVLLGEGNKRPDSIWFERGTDKIRVLVEYERFANHALEKKARNLMFMANSYKDEIELLVLIYWTPMLRPDLDLISASDIFKNGFTYDSSRFGPISCPSIIIETKVTKANSIFAVEGFIVRRFIFEGENKSQIVNNLNS